MLGGYQEINENNQLLENAVNFVQESVMEQDSIAMEKYSFLSNEVSSFSDDYYDDTDSSTFDIEVLEAYEQVSLIYIYICIYIYSIHLDIRIDTIAIIH